MRIIITGGTGLIGRALSTHLASEGHEVVVLSRSPESAPRLPPGVRVARWDARTADGWAALADGAGAIVNLAGASLDRRWTSDYKRVIRESRLNAGRAVSAAVAQARAKPSVVVQASGAGYYGPRGDEILTEEASAGPGFLGNTAVAWEASTASVAEMDGVAGGVRHVIIRSGVVLSTEGGALPRMMLPFQFFVGSTLGTGDQWLSWIHIEDEVRAIRFLIETDAATGYFNVTAPHPVTNREFSRLLGRVMRRPAFFRVPSFVLRLLLGEMSTVVVDGQRAVPRNLLDLGFTFRFPHLDTALRDLLG